MPEGQKKKIKKMRRPNDAPSADAPVASPPAPKVPEAAIPVAVEGEGELADGGPKDSAGGQAPEAAPETAGDDNGVGTYPATRTAAEDELGQMPAPGELVDDQTRENGETAGPSEPDEPAGPVSGPDAATATEVTGENAPAAGAPAEAAQAKNANAATEEVVPPGTDAAGTDGTATEGTESDGTAVTAADEGPLPAAAPPPEERWEAEPVDAAAARAAAPPDPGR